MNINNIIILLLFVVSMPYFFPKKENMIGIKKIQQNTSKPFTKKMLNSLTSLKPVFKPRDPSGSTNNGFFVHIPFHLITLMINIGAGVKDSSELFNKISDFPTKLQQIAYSDGDIKPELSDISNSF